MPRTPADPDARNRLRDAQAAESQAFAAVAAAEHALGLRRRRAADDIAKIEAAVTSALESVAKARVQLVEISGLDRAALLIGVAPKELKRSIARTNDRREEDLPDD